MSVRYARAADGHGVTAIWRSWCHIAVPRGERDAPRLRALTVSVEMTFDFTTPHVWQRRCTAPPPRATSTANASCAGIATRRSAMAKVMVVDDAYSELKLMESILKAAGYQVVTLMDGEALEDKL